MPYKRNKLRMKRESISKKRSDMGKRGNEVKRERLREQAKPLEVVGTMRTDGVFGDHVIEVLSGGDEVYLWMRVDGMLRQPRTLRGIQRVTNSWIYKKTKNRS